MKSTISVVIPAYNAEKYLPTTLRSVLTQTHAPLEVLVVDDGSKDGTAAIAESFGGPVRCVRQPNGGVSRARNTGISQASGDYIALLDADDVWEPTKLEKQVALLDANPDVGLCFVGMLCVDQDLQPIREVPARDYPDFCEALLLYSCVVSGSCSSVVLRRQVAEEAGGFDPQFSTSADWDYWIRLSRRTRMAPIPELLVKYRVFQGSMSSNPALLERDTFAVLDKFYSDDPPEHYVRLKDRCYSNHWMILSGCFLHAGKTNDSFRCALRALKHYPLNIARPLGLPVRWIKRRLFRSTPSRSPLKGT